MSSERDKMLDMITEMNNWNYKKDKIIEDLQSQLDQANERLKEIDNFKYNYGYTNYEDNYMLEDLQSRAFQREDDTAVIESLLDFFDIYDENELLPKVEEINEKLQGAIVPKFKVGQECYYVYTKSQLRPFNIKIGRITFDTDRKNKFLYDSDFEDNDSYFEKYYGMKECDLFTTKEEAQDKLKEIQGNE